MSDTETRDEVPAEGDKITLEMAGHIIEARYLIDCPKVLGRRELRKTEMTTLGRLNQESITSASLLARTNDAIKTAYIVDNPDQNYLEMKQQQDVHVKDLQNQAFVMNHTIKAVTKIDEDDIEHQDNVKANCEQAVTAMKQATSSLTDDCERELWRDHSSLFDPKEYSSRPLLSESDDDIRAFIKVFEKKIKKYASTKGINPTLWFCCWGIEIRKDTKKLNIEMLSKAGIPAYMSCSDVFLKPKADEEVKIENVRLVIRVAREALRLQGKDPERANRLPTIYMNYEAERGFNNTSKKSEKAKKKVLTQQQSKNLHACLKGTAVEKRILSLISREEYIESF